MRFPFLFSFFFFMVTIGRAQTLEFKTAKTNNEFETELSQDFQKVELFQIAAESLNQDINISDSNYLLNVNFGDKHQWEFELYPVDMYSENAVIRVLTENGEITHPVPRNISYKGNVKGDPQKQVSLLIHGSYIYAHITEGTQRTYISSLSRHVKNAPNDIYIIYDRTDQIMNETGTCGFDSYPQFDLGSNHIHEGTGRSQTGLCYDVELGIVSDSLLYIDKGSTIQGVIDHTVGVMMDVETDYETSDFDDALEFEIVEQIVSTCEVCDEWTSSTDSGDLLSDFANWSVNGGFNNSVDICQFWTDRDFDGSTVGLAYRAPGLLCNFAHHVLQDFSNDADLLRVMTSHEIGHNLNAVHDAGSTFVMSPTLNNTTTWSAASADSIDTEVDDAATASCIIACAATPCDPVTDVSITSIDATGFTISWTATTESLYRLRVRDEEDLSIIHTSAPTSSTAMTINPTGWEACHQYMVIVENDCSGSGYSAPVSAIVEYYPGACAAFSADDLLIWVNDNVNFTDESTDATSWSWNFGDGDMSTAQNPSHTYATAGIYDVSLSVNSGAHIETKTSYIHVLPNEVLPYTVADGGNMDDDDFGTESLTSGVNSLFEKGIPSNYFTNSTNCWVTDLDADLTAQENEMVLYSPRYDFSSVSTATLSFDLGMEYQFCNAPFGVQIQYSTNDGSTWTRLGADTDASWYNRGPSLGCSIATTVFTDEMGWNFTSQGFTFTYDIGFLASNSSVIFRFVFSLDSGWGGGYTRDGAMVDDFEISATLLPIELIAFDGKRLNEAVELNWQTATEINNDYFTLERSVDGRNFETIAIVKGQGTTYEEQAYEYLDRDPALGLNYYRLTQTDFDGSFEVFDKIVVIDYVSDINVEVRPNPVEQDHFQLVYNASQSGDLQVEIYNVTGKLLYREDFRTIRNLNYFDISFAGLSNGIYIVKTNQNNFIENTRFVKAN